MKINNTDIQTTYQTHLLDTNYKDLLCYPLLKKLPSNEWAEYYGKEYDTTTPLQGYTYTAPNATLPPSGFTIDGTDLSKYGIYILEETQNTLLPTYEVKEHLTTTSNTLKVEFTLTLTLV